MPWSAPEARQKDVDARWLKKPYWISVTTRMGGHLVRTIGLGQAKAKIGLMNLAYTMKRVGQLLKRDAQNVLAHCTDHGRGASVAV